jgi:5,10-methylenetetrahydromethanopterin reductase
MKIDTQAPIGASITEQVAYIKRAEELGFDGIGLPDHMEHGRDVYTVLAVAADRTNRIELFPCVTNPVTRHAWVLANVTRSMQEIAPGRFRMVIGTGDSAVLNIGTKPAKVAEMRESLTAMKKLLHGEPVAFGNAQDKRIIGIENAQPQPPIVVAVGGERMTELAGELGDEGFLLTGFDDRVLEMVKRHLQAGASRAGRSLDGYKLTHYTTTRVEDDKEAAVEAMRRQLIGWASVGFFRAALEELGAPADMEGLEKLSAPEMQKLGEGFFLIGPTGYIVDRLQDAARKGVLDRMLCVLSSNGTTDALDHFGREILPKVK